MRRTLAIVLGVALVTVAAPATATEDSHREENRAFLIERLEAHGTWDPDRTVEVTEDDETRTMPAEDALELYLDRVEGIPLEQIANSDSHDGEPLVGDILLLNFFTCFDATVEQSTPLPSVQVDPQLTIHGGDALTGNAPPGTIYYANTMKEAGSGDASGATYHGVGAETCFNFGFIEFGILGLNGVLL
jgi:hypothetical protein